ncbi:MAG: PQQ-binding-like beta-propeller repeat protein, partial [Actinomycetota bacterium]
VILLLAGLVIAVGPAAGTPAVEAAGCPQFRCSADHAGTAASTISSQNVAALAPSWSLRTDDRIHGSPSLWSGTLFVPSEDHHVYAVDATTGAQRWAYRTDGAVWSTPAVARGVVYFGSADDHVYALSARTGKLRWKVATGGDISGSPAVSGGVVYVGSNDHRLHALDARTGRVLWTYEAGDRLSSSPAVAGGVVYVGGNDERMHAIDAASGEPLWTFPANGWIWSAPAVADGRVFFTSNPARGGNLYALSAATGEQIWTATGFQGSASPVVVGDTVVAAGFGVVSARDVSSGEARWSRSNSNANRYTLQSPFVSNDLVFTVDSATDGTGNLVALHIASGAVAFESALGVLDFGYSGPVVSGDRVFFGGGNGVLHSFSISPAGEPAELRAVPVPLAPRPFSHRDVLGDMLDHNSVAELRQPGDGVARTCSSADPRGLNTDFTHFHGLTSDGRKILCEVRGAGVLTDLYMYYSLFTTATGPLGPPLSHRDPGGTVAPTIALYVDDNPTPVFDMSAADFYAGEAGFPFVWPLTGEESAAEFSHVPVPFRERLLVVADSAPTENNFWYTFYYTEFPDQRGIQSFDPARDRDRYQMLLDRWVVDDPVPSVPATEVVRDTTAIAPGKSVSLLDVTGPGQISAIRFRYLNSRPPVLTTPSSDPSNDPRATEPLQATRIQARWDNRPELSVDAPIGAFFG